MLQSVIPKQQGGGRAQRGSAQLPSWQMADLCAVSGLPAHQVRYWFKEGLPAGLQSGLRAGNGYAQHAAELLLLLRYLHTREGLKSAGVRRRIGAMDARQRAIAARHQYLVAIRRELVELLEALKR